MPPKKGTQKQKQKQKQKQTVIVNINEKTHHVRRRRKPTGQGSKTTTSKQHQPQLSTIINNMMPKQNINDDVKEILLRLGRGQEPMKNTPIEEAIGTKKVNPQVEVIRDVQDADANLPNRPPASMSSHDAGILRLRARASQQTPFVLLDAEEKTEDINRVQNRLVAPQTPMNAYIEQASTNETPMAEINFGSTPIEEVENKEAAVDAQHIMDYLDTLSKTRPRQPHNEQLLRQIERAPTFAEKAGFPVAQARFLSPEGVKAHAEPAVIQAESRRVNANTDSRLQQADFRNAGEAQEAIKTWNSHQDKSERIKLTRDTTGGKGGVGGYKNLGELQLELASRNLSFKDIKEFHDANTLNSPHNTRKVKGARFQSVIGGSDI